VTVDEEDTAILLVTVTSYVNSRESLLAFSSRTHSLMLRHQITTDVELSFVTEFFSLFTCVNWRRALIATIDLIIAATHVTQAI
jgi:hypothetical protein